MPRTSTRTTWFTQQKQWGLYQNKLTSSLAAIQRPGHWADSCKLVYWKRNIDNMIKVSAFQIQKVSLRPRSHVSGYFWIRNFSFPVLKFPRPHEAYSNRIHPSIRIRWYPDCRHIGLLFGKAPAKRSKQFNATYRDYIVGPVFASSD